MVTKRKYPVGIQSFEKHRKEGYLYIDKTAIIYQMITQGCPYFLSRPRRFGKSLLISTLQAVFEGRRDLFEAFTTEQGIEQPQLFIAQTDWKWEKHPVLRFDFSALGYTTVEKFDLLIDKILCDYEKKYDIRSDFPYPFMRLEKIVSTAHKQTGKRVVVLVDSYDYALNDSLDDEYQYNEILLRLRSLFSPLKSLCEHLQFWLITGISQFSLPYDGTLNQYKDISMNKDYESLCGFTEEELESTLRPDIESFALKRDQTYNDALADLKEKYGSYHFSHQLTDIYNPWSILNAFEDGQLRDFWVESACSYDLKALLGKISVKVLSEVDGVLSSDTWFNKPLDYNYMSNYLSLLYQTGYLTVKECNFKDSFYRLGYPNTEVRYCMDNCIEALKVK